MTAPTVRLDAESVEAVADAVAERLRGETLAGELIDAAEVAGRFGVSRDWVYANKARLGAIYLGEQGEERKPRVRFDPATVAERLASDDPTPEPAAKPKARRRRSRPGVELLPVRGNGR